MNKNLLTKHIKSSLHIIELFGQSTSTICSVKLFAESIILKQYLKAITGWSNLWRMLFNVDKCKVMEFTRSIKSHYNNIELFMDESTDRSSLSFLKEEKDLGNTLVT